LERIVDRKDMLPEKEAAKFVFAKPNTLRIWRYRKRGPAYVKVSGKVFYLKSDLEKFVLEGRVDPAVKRGRGRKASA
jgi:hypothetical protein